MTELQKKLIRIGKLCTKENPIARKTLAGHIQSEHIIDPAELEFIVKPQFDLFSKAYNMYYDRPCQQAITSSWVNYMKVNLILHMCMEKLVQKFSGIIFANTRGSKEQAEFEGTGLGPGALNFRLFQTLDENLIVIEVFSKRGQFYMFPSSLEHMVFPFKSEGERISVAFNTIKRYL